MPTDQAETAGAPEIEVTPEMVEAGEDTILTYGPQPDFAASSWAASLAIRVYRAMEFARCSMRNR